jgi:hypothetical protein
MWSRVQDRLSIAAAPLLTALLCAGFYAPLFVGEHNVWFDHWDMCTLEIPRLQFIATEMHAGHFPFWDPHIWCGQPLVGETQPGPLYPLNLLLAVLPLDAHGGLRFSLLNLYYVWIHVQAALFMYLLCREAGLGRMASVLGGAGFSLSGFLATIPWLDVLNGTVWTPVIFLFLLRVLWERGDGLRNAAGYGICLGLSWLSGHHEIPLLNTVVTMGVWGAWLLARGLRRRQFEWKQVWAFLFGAAITGAVSAAQILPSLEFARHSRRWVGTPAPVSWNEQIPYALFGEHSVSPWEMSTLYVGVTVCVLAAAGLLLMWKQRGAKVAAAIVTFSSLYVLGVHTPVHHLLVTVIPYLGKARHPNRGAYLLVLGLCLLAGFGLEAFLRLAGRFGRAAPVMVFLLLMGAALYEWSGIRQERIADVRAGAICAPRLQAFRRQPAPAGIGRVVGDPAELRTNIGDLLGIGQLRGFVAAASRNLLLHELHTERTQELFGVTHEAGFQQETGMLKWKAKPHPGMREWIAHEAVRVASEEALRRRIQDSRTDLRRTLLTLGPAPRLENCEGAEAIRILWRRSDSLGLRVTLPCRAAVVVSDTYYPGWKATLDGKDAPLTEAYGALRAVVAGKGEHVVTMDYRPAAELTGIVLSLGGLLFGAVVWLRKQATVRRISAPSEGGKPSC